MLPGMPELTPPLFVVQEDDLAILRDADEAAQHFEPWFPREERYSGFDSQGRRFALVVGRSTVPRRLLPGKKTVETVRCEPFEPFEPGSSSAAELSAILRARLDESSDSLNTASLDELVALTVQRNGFSLHRKASDLPGGRTP